MHKTLYNWSAKRSAATMTVKGRDADGNEVKLTGIIEIRPEPDCKDAVFAIEANGAEVHILKL